MPDASVDGATCGFALRNFVALEPFLASLARVVRPGGTHRAARGRHADEPTPALGSLGVLRPRRAAHRRLLSDGAAYRYLPKSVAYLPETAELLDMVRAAGFATFDAMCCPVGSRS